MAKRGFIFGSTPAPKVGYSNFNLSHEFKFTGNMGYLIPIGCFEQLPADVHTIKPSGLVRTQALISPLMHRVDVSINNFQVPLRLLWDGFEDFITGGEDGLQAPQKPYFTILQVQQAYSIDTNTPDTIVEQIFGPGSLLDYMGVPFYQNSSGAFSPNAYKANIGDNWNQQRIDALPFRAYYKVYYDYFRDQNIMDLPKPMTTSGALSADEIRQIFSLRRRCWKKDYFTSALPSSQRGPQVTLPISGTADVDLDTTAFRLLSPEVEDQGSQESSSIVANPGSSSAYNALEVSSGSVQGVISEISGTGVFPKMSVDLSNVSPIGIIALRNAFKLQQFLERNNIAGGRYIENILAHYGIHSPDRRLQRSYYIGGGSQPIVISEIETNANGAGENDNVVGDLAGKGKTFGSFGRVRCMATEHCFVLSLLSVMPTAAYSQGLSRMFTRFDKFDYAWPEFEHIGEQAISSREIYFTAGRLDKYTDFGYSPRYAEYKYLPDRFAGDMKTSLSYWHLGRIFSSKPVLSKEFLECDPSDRIFAVSDSVSEQHLLFDIWFDMSVIRKLSKYSLPGLS